MRTLLRGRRSLLSRQRIAVLLCLAFAVGLGSFFRKRYLPTPLPRGAYPVCSTASWTGGSTYGWMANGDLVYLEAAEKGKARVCYQKMDAKGPVGVVRHGPELPTEAQSGFSPSPDEQWIAYTRQANDPAKDSSLPTEDQTVLISADGKRKRIVSPVGETFVTWLPDSRSFLCSSFDAPYAFKVYHLDSSRVETIPGANRGDILIAPSMPQANAPTFLFGAGAPITQEPTALPSTVQLRSFRAAQPTVVQQTWQTPIPTDASYLSATSSPDNNHLLWTAVSLRDVPLWRDAKITPWGTDFDIETHWFLSDLQGKNMHPILTDLKDNPDKIDFTWTPDSKHLSFLHKDRLYLVPTD